MRHSSRTHSPIRRVSELIIVLRDAEFHMSSLIVLGWDTVHMDWSLS
jgi:hypothetical protein